MKSAVVLLAAICGIITFPASAAEESRLSCTGFAARQAERQYDEENAAREERHTGLTQGSSLRKDLSRLNAESYRRQVYENCMRLRSMPESEQAQPPPR